MLKAGSVTADSPVTITLTVLIDGKTLTDTHNVTIKDIPAPTPSHIVITGATSVNEGSLTPLKRTCTSLTAQCARSSLLK